MLRIEKGHVAGNELNGQTTARDLGLGRMMSTKKEYIGRVMAGRPALMSPDRPTLVGFKPIDPAQRLRAGAHFLKVGAAAAAENDEGYMTSVAYSPHVGSLDRSRPPRPRARADRRAGARLRSGPQR